MNTKPIILDSTPDKTNNPLYVVIRYLDGYFYNEMKSRIDSIWFTSEQATDRRKALENFIPTPFIRIVTVLPNEIADFTWEETFDRDLLNQNTQTPIENIIEGEYSEEDYMTDESRVYQMSLDHGFQSFQEMMNDYREMDRLMDEDQTRESND